jgi:uncharacterized protein (TIGR03437 family)
VNAGGRVNCELRVTASPLPQQIQLTSTSDQVRIPAAVVTRANQGRLMFRAAIDPAARQQAVIVSATLDGATVPDTVFVAPSSAPVLSVPGKRIARFEEPVSFAITGTDSADLPVQLTVAGVPAGATFSPATGGFEWVPNASQSGTYEIAFTATNSARQSSTAQVTIEVDSGMPVLTPSSQVLCSPGSVASLSGKWLAAPGSALSDPSGNAMELGGTRVKVNSQYVPVLFSSATRVNFLCPLLDPGAQLAVMVETASGVTEALTSIAQRASPTIFSLDDSGRNQGLISFAGMNEMVMERNFRVPAHPAQPGDSILIWATGLGPVAEASNGAVSIRLGKTYAEVDSIQAVPGHAGVYTIQARVRASIVFGDAVPVQLEIAVLGGERLIGNIVTASVEPIGQ